MEKFKNKIQETYKKALIIGSFGAAIGAGIGSYIGSIKGNSLYAGIGASIGFVVGIKIGLILGQRIKLTSLISTERIMNLVLGVASFVLALAGIVSFILTKKWIGIIGTLFFGACGIYLLRKKE
jgi:hypothetical protein